MRKTVLITGGSRGIGLGIAQALAREGWDIAINGMRPRKMVEQLLKSLETGENRVIYCRGNIASRADRLKIMDKLLKNFSHLNALVNNAGVAPKERNDLLDLSEQSYDRVMNINLKGPFFLSQLAAKNMIETKNKQSDFQAAIVNISSISASIVSVNRGQYCMSKAGLSMMTQLLATRLGEENIPVYEVRPGIIQTDMTAVVKKKYDKLFREGLAIQPKWGTAEDVGKAVAALLRGDFPYSSGQVFMVDGGLSLQRL